jgi:voltage-gated potassium channel
MEEGGNSYWIEFVDWTIWGIFLAEFIFTAVGRRVFGRRELVLATLVIFSFPALPSFLGLVRVARLLQVTRISRFLRAFRVVGATAWALEAVREILGRRGVTHVATLSAFLVVAGGGVIALLEPQTAHGGFLDGVWWAIVTATTVGYGDIAPTTLLGRTVAVVLMFTGIGLISTLAASITAHFLDQPDKDSIAIKAQLERIESLLEELQADRYAKAGGGSHYEYDVAHGN